MSEHGEENRLGLISLQGFYRNTLQLVMLIILSIVLIVLEHRTDHLKTFRYLLTLVTYPIQKIASFPVDSVHWLDESLTLNHTLQRQNKILSQQNLQLNASQQKMISLQAENMRLRSLLQSSRKLNDDMLIAQTIAVSGKIFRHTIELDKGNNDKVKEQQAVVDAYGVIGQIQSVGVFSSSAILITDPEHAIPIKLKRNNYRAVAYGTGSKQYLELPNLPNNVDIQVGDMLISSGLGGVFPEGYPVALVEQVQRDNSKPFASIQAAPIAHLDRSQEVLIVLSAE